jgi:hypothetical protein
MLGWYSWHWRQVGVRPCPGRVKDSASIGTTDGRLVRRLTARVGAVVASDVTKARLWRTGLADWLPSQQKATTTRPFGLMSATSKHEAVSPFPAGRLSVPLGGESCAQSAQANGLG